MKVLIVGINGFIGSHVAEGLSLVGHEVYGIDRTVGIGKYNTEVFDVVCDNISEMLRSIRPDVIINCAGHASVPNSIAHPEADLMENTVLVHKILFAIKQLGFVKIRFVQLSSAAVYGNPDCLPISENSEIKPLSPYALHKMMAEDICLYFSKECGIDIKVLRLFSVYGNGLRKQIFWDLYQKYRESGRLSLLGTGEESRDYIHIDDLVSAIRIIVETDSKNVIWNIASGCEVYIKEVADIFARKLGLALSEIEFNGCVRQGDPINWWADISRIKAEGFVPQISIEQGISEYISWVKNDA